MKISVSLSNADKIQVATLLTELLRSAKADYYTLCIYDEGKDYYRYIGKIVDINIESTQITFKFRYEDGAEEQTLNLLYYNEDKSSITSRTDRNDFFIKGCDRNYAKMVDLKISSCYEITAIPAGK